MLLQCVAVCCSVLQRVAACRSVLFVTQRSVLFVTQLHASAITLCASINHVLQYGAENCDVSHYVTICCSMLQWVAERYNSTAIALPCERLKTHTEKKASKLLHSNNTKDEQNQHVASNQREHSL